MQLVEGGSARYRNIREKPELSGLFKHSRIYREHILRDGLDQNPFFRELQSTIEFNRFPFLGLGNHIHTALNFDEKWVREMMVSCKSGAGRTQLSIAADFRV